MTDNSVLNDVIAFELEGIQRIYLSAGWESALDRLVEQIKKLVLESNVVIKPLAPTRLHNRSNHRFMTPRFVTVIGSVLIATLVVFGGIYIIPNYPGFRWPETAIGRSGGNAEPGEKAPQPRDPLSPTDRQRQL